MGSSDPATVVERLRRFFQDKPLVESDLEEWPLWVVARILEYGDVPDVRLLAGYYGRERFLSLVARSRFVSPKTESLWLKILELEGVPCTRKPSPPEAWTFWPG